MMPPAGTFRVLAALCTSDADHTSLLPEQVFRRKTKEKLRARIAFEGRFVYNSRVDL
jgi:hypothetical protein